MAVVVTMHWPEVTKEMYLAAVKEVDWENNQPKGAMFHVASMGEDGFRVTDIWNSAEEFQAFVETRLMPGTQKVGIPGQPNVIVGEVVRTFTPAFTPK